MKRLPAFQRGFRLGHEWMERGQPFTHNDAILWLVFKDNLSALGDVRSDWSGPVSVNGDRLHAAVRRQRLLPHLVPMMLFRPPAARRHWDVVSAAQLRQASV